jgi:hypothetical protein
MRPARHLLLFALASPVLASCAFLLDFDSLQAENGDGTGGRLLSGGTSGTAGTDENGGSGALGGGEAGAGGNAGCSSSCFDEDPCTVDGCDENGECVADVLTGLVPDGIDETIGAARHYRVTAVGGDDDFFLSVFSEGDNGASTAILRLPAEGGALETIATLDASLGEDDGPAASAAGLAFQPGTGLLHAYAALKNADGSASRVRHFVINGSSFEMLASGLVVGDSYWDASPFQHPVAATLGDVPTVAWINEDQSIGVDGGGLEQVETLAAGTPAHALALIGTDGAAPAVIYGTADGVLVERPGSDPVTVDECQSAPGAYLSITSTRTTVPGFWLATWTKLGPETDENEGFLTSEGLGLYCADDATCLLQQRDCDDVNPNNLVRNTASTVVHRPGTAAGLVEVVQATPLIGPGEEPDTLSAGILLSQTLVDFGIPPLANPPESEELAPPIALSAQETTEEAEFRGPDWPALAHVAPDRYLVSWIELGADGGDALRVQRYRMCLP